MVSFIYMISTFYLLKPKANDVWIRISQFEFFTSLEKSPKLLLAVPGAIWWSIKLARTSLKLFQLVECFEICWITPTKSSCRARFLSLEEDDNDATKVVLVLGWVLYEVYEVYKLLVSRNLQGLWNSKKWTSWLNKGVFEQFENLREIEGVLELSNRPLAYKWPLYL